MRKLHTPKRITLPNGRTFLPKCKRVTWSELPANVTLARRYRGRVAAGRRTRPPRKGERGSRFFDTLKKNSKKSISKTIWEKNTDSCSKTI